MIFLVIFLSQVQVQLPKKDGKVLLQSQPQAITSMLPVKPVPTTVAAESVIEKSEPVDLEDLPEPSTSNPKPIQVKLSHIPTTNPQLRPIAIQPMKNLAPIQAKPIVTRIVSSAQLQNPIQSQSRDRQLIPESPRFFGLGLRFGIHSQILDFGFIFEIWDFLLISKVWYLRFRF